MFFSLSSYKVNKVTKKILDIFMKNNEIDDEFAYSDVSAKAYISGITFDRKLVEYAVVNDDAIFEGDIILGSHSRLQSLKKLIETPLDPIDSNCEMDWGVIISGARYRWPHNQVIYSIDNSVPGALQKLIDEAIEHWQDNTNIRFAIRYHERNYVEIKHHPSKSSSYVGMPGNGPQTLNLADWACFGTVVHEIGHAIGLWHEHSREDRDEYVTIMYDNIMKGAKHNFNQHIDDGQDIGSYDYGSIMHYPKWAFAIDSSKPTIVSKNGQEIGQRLELSQGDINTVNSMYPRRMR